MVGKERDPAEQMWDDQPGEVDVWQERQTLEDGIVGITGEAGAVLAAALGLTDSAALLMETSGEGSQGSEHLSSAVFGSDPDIALVSFSALGLAVSGTTWPSFH